MQPAVRETFSKFGVDESKNVSVAREFTIMIAAFDKGNHRIFLFWG
jgi:hypothetical protein